MFFDTPEYLLLRGEGGGGGTSFIIRGKGLIEYGHIGEQDLGFRAQGSGFRIYRV